MVHPQLSPLRNDGIAIPILRPSFDSCRWIEVATALPAQSHASPVTSFQDVLHEIPGILKLQSKSDVCRYLQKQNAHLTDLTQYPSYKWVCHFGIYLSIFGQNYPLLSFTSTLHPMKTVYRFTQPSVVRLQMALNFVQRDAHRSRLGLSRRSQLRQRVGRTFHFQTIPRDMSIPPVGLEQWDALE